METISFELDGQTIDALPEETILQAADSFRDCRYSSTLLQKRLPLRRQLPVMCRRN